MGKYLFAFLWFAIATKVAIAQNSIGINNNAPAQTAALDITSTTQGLLVPRMNAAQRALIGSPGVPATGLLVYQTDGTPGFYFYNGSAWVSLSSGTAGGDLSGTYPNPTINTSASTGANIVTAINASSSTINAVRLQNSVTTQGNIFNGANGLLKLDGTGKLPALDGSQLTNLTASPSGMLCNNSVGPTGQTTFYLQPFAYNSGTQYIGNDEIVMPFACTLDNFYVSLVVNNNTAQASSTTLDLTVMKNGSATSLAISGMNSPTALNTYVTTQDLTHSVSLAAGDRITIKCVVGNAAPAFRIATALKYH